MDDTKVFSRQWEAIDTTWVFRLYALLAALVGFALLGWGGVWFGPHLDSLPWGKAALLRVLGSLIIAAACCAAAFALFWVAFALFYLWGTADGQPRPVPLLSLFGTRPRPPRFR